MGPQNGTVVAGRGAGRSERKRVTEERFLPLVAVEQELLLSTDQVIGLITSGELPAVKILGLWRVERCALEHFIRDLYVSTALDLQQQSPEHATPPPEGGVSLRSESSSAWRRTVQERHADLTPQMQRVLQLVAQGHSNVEIAQELTIEVSTVKSHVSRLLSRLDCRDRENLIALAWRSRLVDETGP